MDPRLRGDGLCLPELAIAAMPAAKSVGEMEAALASLQTSAGGDFDSLVPQLLYFSMRATDVRAGNLVSRARRDPTLRTPALMQRLRADPHPAVRAAVADLR